MILSNIVEEIMNDDSQSVVTYSNDGSSLNRTGSFAIQSFNINGVQRILPTLGIFSETKKISRRIDSNNTRNTFCSHWMYVYILKVKLWQKLIL